MPVAMIDGEEPRITLVGAVGITDAQPLAEAAIAGAAKGRGDVVVELALVDSIDTAATQVLLALRAELAAAGRALRLVDVPACVSVTWRVLGVDGTLG